MCTTRDEPPLVSVIRLAEQQVGEKSSLAPMKHTAGHLSDEEEEEKWIEERGASRPSPSSSPLSSSSLEQQGGDTAIAPFLAKLSAILSVEDRSIVCWSEDGLSFEIHDQQRFIEEILPKYFRHNRYASFQRQLNYFGFRKLSKFMSDICTYSRPHFTRDKPQELKLIRRNKKSSSQKKAKSVAAFQQQQRMQSGAQAQSSSSPLPLSYAGGAYGGPILPPGGEGGLGRKRPLDVSSSGLAATAPGRWTRGHSLPSAISPPMYLTPGQPFMDFPFSSQQAPPPHPAARGHSNNAALFTSSVSNVSSAIGGTGGARVGASSGGREGSAGFSLEEEMAGMYRAQSVDPLQFELGLDVVSPFLPSLTPSPAGSAYYDSSLYFPEPLPLLSRSSSAEEIRSKIFYAQPQRFAPPPPVVCQAMGGSMSLFLSPGRRGFPGPNHPPPDSGHHEGGEP